MISTRNIIIIHLFTFNINIIIVSITIVDRYHLYYDIQVKENTK